MPRTLERRRGVRHASERPRRSTSGALLLPSTLMIERVASVRLPVTTTGPAEGPVGGWVLDATPTLLALEVAGGALALVDDRGGAVARLEGAAADAIRRRLAGEPADLPPALRIALREAPGLEAALERPAFRLAPDALLRRGRWQQLFVELTATCNERCRHCYAGSGPERREALDRATAEAVVREAAALGFEVVQLTGGEALLCPFLADLCALARGLGVPVVEVYTNGVLLTDERYRPLREAGVSFAFSLYAADPAAHDAVTGVAGSHARTVTAIRRALAGGSRVRVGVIATRPEDEEEARRAASLARDLGVPPERVGVQVARAVGRGTFAGRAEAPAAAPGAGEDPTHGHATREPGRAQGGKAAVLPDGWVVPCIFSRELRLGRVGPEGGLRAALERPAAHLAGRADLAEGGCARRALGALEAALTCGECRLVTALLLPGDRA